MHDRARDFEPDAVQVPHSLEAERAVIGAVLLEPNAHERVADLLSAADFFTSQHRLAWGAIEAVVASGKTPDAVTVSESVPPAWRHDCPFAFLQTLALESAGGYNVRRYAEIIRDRRIRRDLMIGAERLRELALSAQHRSAADILDEAQSVLSAMGQEQSANTDDGSHLADALRGVLDDVDSRLGKPEDHLGGTSTGLAALDEETDGLQDGDLIVIAGRPAMGKTALAMGIAQKVAAGGKTVQVFSLEMPVKQIAQRMLASDARVDLQNLRRARLSHSDWDELNGAMGRMRSWPIIIDDSAPLTVAKLRAKAKRLARRAASTGKPLGLIVVDYLQLMSGDGDNRNQVVSEISRGLKLLAKELRIPVVALSQLNRKVEERSNRRPMMHDIRESGAVEQDADLIIFVYRDQVYDISSADRGMAELIIGKQRNGPPGTVRVAFLEREATFRNLPQGWQPAKATEPKPYKGVE